MSARVLQRHGLLVARRASAGGRRFLHKNEHMEEWNGMREDTHKTWELTSKNALRVFLLAVVFPGFVLVGSAQDEIGKNLRNESFNSPKTNKYV